MRTEDPIQAERPTPLTEKSALQAAAEKPLPKPEDFSDPKVAAAVRAMLEALDATGWKK